MSDIFNRVDAFMQWAILNENSTIPADKIDEMFSLHNEAWHPILRETSKRCSSCQQRCYKNLKNWWIDNGGKPKG